MEDIKAALKKLERNGMLRPDAVVEAARDVKSPLHTFFTWDDSEAAKKWREEQARQLIRSVKIEVNAGVPTEIRAYVSLPADRENGGGYRPIQEVMNSEFMRRQLAEDINRKVQSWEKQAAIIGAIVDFSPMREIAQKVSV